MAKPEPERTCIVTRQPLEKERLIRFVLGPDDRLVPDLTGKLPGRGIYVTCSRLAVAEAISKRAFSKAAQQQVHIPDDLLANLEQQLGRRMADALSLARKAGQVLTGFEKVDEAVKSGEVAALVHALDASADQVRKLRDDEIPTFQNLPREVLSQVLGRDNAVHVAVLHGSAGQFFIESARRFALFME